MTGPIDNPVVIHIGIACKGNPGPGGWGVVMSREGRDNKELRGGTFWTTSHEMELTAAIEALGALKRPLPVRLLTNSAYMVEGMTRWLEDWKAKGWRRSDGKPVANPELWKRLDELATPHSVEWVHSSTGGADSKRAHQLANLGIRQASQ